MVGVHAARNSAGAAIRRSALFLALVLAAGSAAGTDLFGPAVVYPAYSGAAPLSPVTRSPA
jgi:hypothetical protein